MTSGQEIAIHTEGLTKTYRSGAQELTVFADLHLEVIRGERLAIIGESGSGKSSLLHLLGGLDRPTRGTIWFGSTEVGSLSPEQAAAFRNREIGFVWQTHYLLPEFTALENVMMPLLIGGASRANAAPQALARLEEVGLRARAHHRSGELSGGEQQRVVLARALVTNPKVLLADEPTGNLDHRTGDRIFALLEETQERHGITTVLVTHNLRYAERCHRIFSLEKPSEKGSFPLPGADVPQSESDRDQNGRDYV